ncbi:organ-specific protein P4 [Cajanus cajan]|uniref:Organ-specific protein P4 n=1 Tax=Cajanus cajan TaxID=3821 RepID=A0A151QV51_CAJCA|nr:organ-specific protein P4 [Cajanus cajan]KYP34075.1 hypothetical protein KK1_045011 [Cajanus cajan]
MKSNFAVIVVFSLLLVANFGCARKDLGAYWKNMMKGQAMPQAIKDLVEASDAVDAGTKNRFVRDFDVKPNVILYHTHVKSSKQKQKLFLNNNQD